MLLSALVAIVLTPALCATILKPAKHGEKRGIAGWFNWNFDRTTSGYTLDRLSAETLAARDAAVCDCNRWLWAGCSRDCRHPWPQEDQGVLLTIVQLPNGATQARTEEIIKNIETYYLRRKRTRYRMSLPFPASRSPDRARTTVWFLRS